MTIAAIPAIHADAGEQLVSQVVEPLEEEVHHESDIYNVFQSVLAAQPSAGPPHVNAQQLPLAHNGLPRSLNSWTRGVIASDFWTPLHQP